MARESYFSAGTAPLERFARGVYGALPKSLEEANEMFNPVEILQDAGSKSKRFVESGGRDTQAGVEALVDTATLGVGPAAYGVASLFRTPLKKGSEFATKAIQEAFNPLGASDDRVEELGSELLTKGKAKVNLDTSDPKRPLRLFHGTTRDFEGFDPDAPMHYFSPDPKEVDYYAGSSFGRFDEGARVIPVYLKDANYFDVDNPEHLKILEQSDFYKKNADKLTGFSYGEESFLEVVESGDYEALEKIASELKKLGFDGHTAYEGSDKNFAVYDTDLIVSGIEKKAQGGLATLDHEARDMFRKPKGIASLTV